MPSLVNVSRAIGTPAFAEALLEAVNDVVSVDHCTVFSFHRNDLSGCLLTVGKADLGHVVRLCEEYMAGAYLDDPHLRYVETRASPKVIVHVSVDDHAEHLRRRFVEDAGIVDMIACIASKDDRTVDCRFFRLAGNPGFDGTERARLESVLPILGTLTAVHYTLCGPFLLREQLTRVRTPANEVRLLAERLGPSALDRLTAREREVCFRILLGYSSEAIALHLGIATSTILTYRKRAYEKLGIVSQNELFSLYLHSLPGFTI